MIESEIIVALGSNTYPRENIEKAKRLLTERFGPETVFSSFMKTSPIGMSGPDFINCIMATRSAFTTEQATAALKETERLCGVAAAVTPYDADVNDPRFADALCRALNSLCGGPAERKAALGAEWFAPLEDADLNGLRRLWFGK